MSECHALTGKPSVDRPWLKYYTEEQRQFQPPRMGLAEFLQYHNTDHDKEVVEYYGVQFSLNQMLAMADRAAKAMAAIGVKEGDQIPVFLKAVPEFLFLLLAAEKVGATLICRDGTREENLEAIQNANSRVMFIYDYLSQEEKEYFRANSKLEKVVLVSPYTYAKKEEIPDYVERAIQALYPEVTASGDGCLNWEQFLAMGDAYTGSYEAPANLDRPLYHPYTSGSTGPSKEIIHSGGTMTGVISQLIIPMLGSDFTFKILMPILPPALIAVVNSLMLFGIAMTNLTILSPFVELEDLDLEFLRCTPNHMVAIPQMADVVMKSKRIPEDYPMQFMVVFGGGADSMNNKWLRNTQEYLAKHGSPAVYSMCYGLSECGSVVTNPHETSSFMDCGAGIPMLANTVSIFEADSQNELGYNQVGEICVTGPGIMHGYSNREDTEKALQRHPDGKMWVHTGDAGYMNENGELFTLGRGLTQRYGYDKGYLFVVPMENKIVDLPGVKDAVFVNAKDWDHEGYFRPYLFLILEEGAQLSDVEEEMRKVLEPHEYPVEIRLIKEREYFHFKTNRRILAERIWQEHMAMA